MEEAESDKTEQPTLFKLDRSRKKGVVARGSDLGFLSGLAALFAYIWIAGPRLTDALGHMAYNSWIAGPQLVGDPHALLAATASLTAMIIGPLLLLFAVIFSTVLLIEFVQTGAVFSVQPLTPDFSRLSPANGLKRVFSVRALIEAGKNILKILAYSTLGVLVVRSTFRSDVPAIMDAHSLALELRAGALRLLAVFVLGAIFFAVLDQLIVRTTFVRRMRMSRRELRRETREREGEPRLKQKRKQLHREFARASQSLRNLRKADVLITNPHHIALALRYDPKSMSAPMIVSIGVNHFAQRLKRIAFLYGIPIVENRILAHVLYRKAQLNELIPQECYRPVANIYNGLRARMRKNHGETTDA